MNTNRLLLTGKICHTPIRKVSPAGVPHFKFVLDHRSQQKEAGFYRRVWCKIIIIASGQRLQKFACSITAGSQVTITGFVSSHQGANGLNNLVLHAEQIELISSGD